MNILKTIGGFSLSFMAILTIAAPTQAFDGLFDAPFEKRRKKKLPVAASLFPLVSLVPTSCASPAAKHMSQADVDAHLQANQAYKITRSGYYCLTEDIHVDRFVSTIGTNDMVLFSIAASDVTIDLNGFGIYSTIGPLARNGISHQGRLVSTRAVQSTGQSHERITVKNGTIQGFHGAVALPSANNVMLSNLYLYQNYSGISGAGQSWHIHNNTMKEVHDGIVTDPIQDMTAHQNRILLVSHTHPHMHVIQPIGMRIGNARSVVMRNNTIEMEDPTSRRVSLAMELRGEGMVVQSNTVRDTQSGLRIGRNSSGVDIANNTLKSSSHLEAITLHDTSTNVHITKNAFRGYGMGILVPNATLRSPISGTYTNNRGCGVRIPLNPAWLTSLARFVGSNNTWLATC